MANKPLHPEDILPWLDRRDVRLELHRVLSSTNDRARELARAGAPALTLVVAEEQTAGRGRQGRPFFSPAGTGVYMSLLLRPERLDRPEQITAAAAVAAARAVEHISGRAADIKWVNDVYVDGRKTVGILTEAGATADGAAWAVLGIGVNLLPPEGGFPDELAGIAGAVLPIGGQEVRGRLIACILNEFMTLYPGAAEQTLLAEYRRRDFLHGKEVYIIQNQAEEKVLAVGIDDAFRLIVRRADGTAMHLNAGEVHIKPL